MVPKDLERVLAEVAGRRCASCHKPGRKGQTGLPRKQWVRVTNPGRNSFLLAPLAKRHGGTGKCGKAVFSSTEDPDYQAILKTFQPITKLLEKTPRMDMAHASVPSETRP